ncbi:MAG: hypothetical protein UT31_C0039G0005 [Parcubacteria group bacterium GW2011_GWF2_39_13b]|nr:MAG: hypothetical protein UT31_C0039G0005 [Parcubacteria group bacterium GW2011_GWF2_39_13b]
MIKKNTKVIFKDGENKKIEDMVGGIPLSKGEIIRVHENDKVVLYEVVDKIVDCFLNGEDQVIDIIYIVERK